MPVDVHWHDEDRRNICYTFTGKWTWDDLDEAIVEVVAMLDSIDYPVHLIIDVRNSKHVPTFTFSRASRVANAPTMSHPNTKNLLMVGANRYVEVMVRVFKRAFPKAGARYHLYRTVEDLEAALNGEMA